MVEGVETWIDAEDAHIYLLSALVAISIKIRWAKNDQGGRGFQYYFTRNPSRSSTAAFDLVEDMFILACLALIQQWMNFAKPTTMNLP